MNSKYCDSKDIRKDIFVYLFCLIVGFAYLSVTSGFSYLSRFHPSDDVHVFRTVARVVENGGILYRDVFDVKGPYLHLIYYLARLLTGESVAGIFIIEIALCSLSLFFSYKIVTIFVSQAHLQILSLIILGCLFVSPFSFYYGGQVEELFLSFVLLAIYLLLRYFKRGDLSVLPIKEAFVIGMTFAIVFWMKFSLVGIYLGAVIAIVVIFLRNKKHIYLLKMMLAFLIGAIAGTTPIICYFVFHGDLTNLYENYFLKVLYYGNHCVTTDQTSPKIVLAMAFVFVGCLIFLLIKRLEYRLLLISMLVTQGICTLYGFVFRYTGGVLYVFLPIVVGCAASKVPKAIELVKEVTNYQPQKHKNNHSIYRIVGMSMLAFVLLAFAFFSGIYPTCFTQEQQESQDFFIFTKYIGSRNENPVVIYWDVIDIGIYDEFALIPKDKYFCSYNFLTPSDIGLYEKYIQTHEADYVIASTSVPQLESSGYEQVDGLNLYFVLYQRMN